MTEIFRKPKIGVLLIEAERFRALGEGTVRGTYAVRKDAEAAAYINKIQEFADVVYPGPVWERDGAERAARLFYNEGVDCVAAGFFSFMVGGFCLNRFSSRVAADAAVLYVGGARFARHNRYER